MKSMFFLPLAVAGVVVALPARSAPGGTDKAETKTDSENKTSLDMNSKDFMPTGVDDPAFEKPHTTYRFVGVRFREVWVPKFMMTLFGSGGTTVGVPSFGPEFTIRKDGFEYVLSAMYSSYSMDPTAFKAKTDGNDAWEIVDANIKVLYLMSDFLWSSEVAKHLSVVYGAGVGLGVVWGDIHRVQAYPTGDPNNPDVYVACPSRGFHAFCGSDNDHYGAYTEPSWADGGSKPIIFPWLAIQTGLRFKPAKQFMTRLDLGWNLLNGPFLGISGSYGL
jgi:hypothetical protein